MRREQHLGAEVLLDLRGVAVVEQAVRREVLVDGAERRARAQIASGAGDAAGGVDDDPRRFDETPIEQRSESQRRGGDVAPGRGNQAGADEIAPTAFGEAVDSTAEQLRLIVSEPVPPRIGGRIAEPERRREIDDAPDLVDELRHDTKGGLVGQSEEDEIEPGVADLVNVEPTESEVGERHRQ